MLNGNLQFHFLPFGGQDFTQFNDVNFAVADINHHNHGEKTLHNGLADIQDIDTVLGQNGGYHGNNTHPVMTQNADNNAFSFFRPGQVYPSIFSTTSAQRWQRLSCLSWVPTERSMIQQRSHFWPSAA